MCGNALVRIGEIMPVLYRVSGVTSTSSHGLLTAPLTAALCIICPGRDDYDTRISRRSMSMDKMVITPDSTLTTPAR